MTIESFMMLLCGLGLFLYGMKLMGDGLELAAGSKLKTMIERLTTNKYMGALIGLAVTAVIQSSSATTVMVVGFVNAGLMNLAQAVGVIMGANIGTTVTGFLIAIKLNSLAPIAIFLGVVMMMFCKKNSHKHVGQIVCGFGILFYGMTVMSTAMEPLSQSAFFRNLFIQMQNPLLGLLVGMIFTALIQSSSASVGVLQALAASGAISLHSAVYVIYGQNIGTCITAVMACVGANKTAKRTATVHLLFNVIGATLFTLLTMMTPFTSIVQRISPDNVLMQISIVHIVFNIVTTALLLPLSNYLVKLACKVIPGEDRQREALRLKYLDQRILNTPPIAVAQVLKEVERMAKLARLNFLNSMEALFHKDQNKLVEVAENETVLNFLNQKITEYLVQINGLELQDPDRELVGALFHVVSDFERIGDHSTNIGEMAQIVIDNKADLSGTAVNELKHMQGLVTSIIDDSLRLFEDGGRNKILADQVDRIEETIDDETERLKENHIQRLTNGTCTPQSGAIYNDMLMNLERIADHATNIAFSTQDIKNLPAKGLLPNLSNSTNATNPTNVTV